MSKPLPPKLSFFEFVQYASNSFDDPSSVEWTESWFKHFIDISKNGKHEGDCTKQAHTCDICCMESFLSDYHNYIFQYEQWVKDNF